MRSNGQVVERSGIDFASARHHQSRYRKPAATGNDPDIEIGSCQRYAVAETLIIGLLGADAGKVSASMPMSDY